MTQSFPNETTLNDGAKRLENEGSGNFEESPAKRIKLDKPENPIHAQPENNGAQRKKGTAPIREEYLVRSGQEPSVKQTSDVRDDDEAEAARHQERAGEKGGKQRKKQKGQNTARKFGKSQDEKGLCQSVSHSPELSPRTCQFGDNCRFEHNLRKYLKEYKREDLKTFNGMCPVWDAYGLCFSGWKCRFVGSHMTERELEDGRKELVLVEDEERKNAAMPLVEGGAEGGVFNSISTEQKVDLMKKRRKTPKSDAYTTWLDETSKQLEIHNHGRRFADENNVEANGEARDEVEDRRAQFKEPPFLPSEKRRLYFGSETPVLAPLTTQGNLPFRRLCVELGAQFTYSEMAMSLPIVQGHKGEWALMKAHQSEVLPPTIKPNQGVVKDYDHSRDLKFGVQISANKPWQALKATEVMTALCPHLRVVDLNCGCPIDLVYRDGAGSALLEHPSKLEKILRGMNAVSNEVPVSAKIRMGTKDNSPTALKLIERLVLGGPEFTEIGQGPAGVAAITLHGRSRQQRYTREADWSYISECAALIRRLNERSDDLTDTIREADDRLQAPGRRVYFLGNGDCYSHEDYYRAIGESGVDTVMIARGALMKPWIFEEIQAGQYLDKSASERLSIVEKFAKYGLNAWGSDEHGVGTTRRFLLELLSFTHRYIPIGLLEHLPPRIQDRPPAYKGRNELETLLASDNYKDWIKISEMFLGPAHKDFKFEPKHKSNSYEIEG
ncbi:tRNA-dihydrouridine(47) synthase [NAD(P)(+)] [Coccidioides immitis RS]|uniref:tRNA-dihydrouridine(47) synthase [NAD(P)(+)] n=2 Tax=Coccidioides immitis TaxID=5501 RepID=DUS3_COCIM|nr:tRNA-dihydrouridine(47) synthase [NAD(P)(+)] [Coccidioides immitis RS]Q1E2F4.1 RecName: Full=tRNA-dihydrouridine(47) synthase [NAD(P)(+)]; AltName: Full=mRNA-dihydrouridine synthase DUS3; AltName: Full=tRNA-dihydrouridine synthase 3 [Coccidioides immitis RS]KJF61475.1 tRNA-dihydrouridine(47) synthase [NAD(P)(+)] [Coccidioides immitis RS]KMU82528.1 tRNA-dihydrouridine synthase B [Coccidioides immitis H538.4]